MKLLYNICRILLGAVFLFSGFVKGVDPLGTIYKFQDYFSAFSLSFLIPLAPAAAFFMIAAEFMTGVSLLLRFFEKWGAALAIIFMSVFTPLTLVLAFKNPVTDCGCFGDAIHLTNWQTFGKNVILLLPAIFVAARSRLFSKGWKATIEFGGTLIVLLLFIGFMFYNIIFLPVIDFLPYSVGTNIPEAMKIPEDKPQTRYETTFIYEKGGVQKEFSVENYPADDSTWIFVDSKSVLIEKGYEPPIHDLYIMAPDGRMLTDLITTSPGYIFLMISVSLEKADQEKLNKGIATVIYLTGSNTEYFLLTASSGEEVESMGGGLPVGLVDAITLKTMVRSNPGYMLIKGGTIMGKWSSANLPEADELLEIINNQ